MSVRGLVHTLDAESRSEHVAFGVAPALLECFIMTLGK